MKMVWKKKSSGKKRPRSQLITQNPSLLFQSEEDDGVHAEDEKKKKPQSGPGISPSNVQDVDRKQMSESFEQEGNQLAEGGRYRQALQKWEVAITLMPDRAILHEQKAQVLLEIGDTWSALIAATRATELEPLWAEAWVTLGRAQLNFGEPDLAIYSFDRALAVKPDHEDALIDRETALHLVKMRKLQPTDTNINLVRYKVVDKGETSNDPILLTGKHTGASGTGSESP